MSKHRWVFPALALLGGAGWALAQPAPPEKDALIDAFEGYPPELTKYALEGHFDAKRQFALEIALEGKQWTIKFRHAGKEARIFALPSKDYPSLDLGGAFVVTRSPSPTEPVIMVVIPFGEPQTECFLNGEDVFRKLIFYYDADKLKSVAERTFKDCNEEWQDLPLDAASKG